MSVLIAAGIVIILNEEGDVDIQYENLYRKLKSISECEVGQYYSACASEANKYYLLQGHEGDDMTNKVYFFPSTAVIWSSVWDGCGASHYYDSDGLENAETFVEKVISAKEDAQTKLQELCGSLGLENKNVKIIRFTSC